MSLLVDRDTRLVVQGITGNVGTLETRFMLQYGTKVVAGVTPGKGGRVVEGVSVFDSMPEAVDTTDANASIIFVPPPHAACAILEAVDSGVSLVVCITEGIPVKDMVRVFRSIEDSDVRLVGPNCPGITTPGEARVGIMPDSIFLKGNVGVVSRSGTLTYEVVDALSRQGIGQSNCVGIGGDPLIGTSFIDALEMFENDPGTSEIVMIGEIGGTAEQEAAEYIREHVDKPVVGYVVGVSAPPGKTMGHAGAIISGGGGTAKEKIEALESAGVAVADSPVDVAGKINSLI
ncbi:MAG: succinate--CoA ligase subunit alpha [ANME-2 cluster archaeon]|nr:succinate--CoA ligase subunit alpha [ANME-2 cluster archaeon]MBC2700152.1 succinate--CoA ligase subunit alpha [ANME-2 cluster archaeon]MBC2706686.1 succinate--CoA ligase subunit alpha [ANME-2 cluster archaeon]MBC2745640.1 succinate--CoA ligase subunit alpha [ANME-2 cluster archaeon]MBC2762828.1 succinate--CoA ligase subunit alpha [ANME-2 cluster archaeon]